jgi:hypothetical protein
MAEGLDVVPKAMYEGGKRSSVVTCLHERADKKEIRHVRRFPPRRERRKAPVVNKLRSQFPEDAVIKSEASATDDAVDFQFDALSLSASILKPNVQPTRMSAYLLDIGIENRVL